MFVVLITAIIFFGFPKEVHAYLDPGSGSYFIQFLLGIVLGGLVSIKIFWHKISHYLKKISSYLTKNK